MRSGDPIAAAMKRSADHQVRPYAHGRAWGALSSVLTRWSSRFARDVIVRCFPGAGAYTGAPGCIDLKTGVMLLDGDTLPSSPETWQATLSAEQQQATAVLLGVCLHECGHAQHTDPAVRGSIDDAVLNGDMRLLEEPRMEARLIQTVRCAPLLLRAASMKIDLDDLQPVTDRDSAATLGVLVLGRRHAGVLDAGDVALAERLVEDALGAGDLQALHAILARTATIADGDAAALEQAAFDLRALIGHPPPDAGGRGQGAGVGGGQPGGQPGATGTGSNPAAAGASGATSAPSGGDPASALAELKAAMSASAQKAASAAGAHASTHDQLAQVAGATVAQINGQTFVSAQGGLLAGTALGRKLPPPGRREPLALERAAQRRLAQTLRKARTKRVAREGRVRPPGRFNARGAARADHQRRQMQVITAQPWRAKATLTKPLWKPQAVMAIDTSGSMGSARAALGSVLWVVHGAVRSLGGDLVAATFGDSATPLVDAAQDLRLVPEVPTGGGTDHVGAALDLGLERLPMLDARRPRLCVLLTDGVWSDAHGQQRMRDLRDSGCAVVLVGIGDAPRHHDDVDEHVVVADALTVADVLATALVRALTAGA